MCGCGRGGRELVWGWYGFGMELVRMFGGRDVGMELTMIWYDFGRDLVWSW